MIRHVEGACYAEAASEGFDSLGPNNSQGYIAHVNTAMVTISCKEILRLRKRSDHRDDFPSSVRNQLRSLRRNPLISPMRPVANRVSLAGSGTSPMNSCGRPSPAG